MRSRWVSLTFLAIFAGLALMVFWALGYFGPRYAGLPADAYFLDAMGQNSFGGTNDRQKILLVPSQVGVPVLTRYTEAQDPRWRGWYQRIYPKLPRFITRRFGVPQSKENLVLRSVMALGYYGPAAHPAVPRLLQMESNNATSTMLRQQIIYTLGSVGPAASNAIPMLILNFNSGTLLARAASAALGPIDRKGEKSGTLLIASLAKSPSRAIGYYNYNYADPLIPLRQMATNEPKWISEVWLAIEKSTNHSLLPRGVQFVHGFGALDDARFAVVLEQASSNDVERRQSAVAALQYPTERASTVVPRLINFLDDANSNVVVAARLSLWNHADSTNAPIAQRVAALRSLFPLEEEKKWPALSIVWRLGPAGLPLLDEVIILLRDPHERVRGRAAEAVAAMGPGARAAKPALEPLLSDKWGFVRDAAEQALQSFKMNPPDSR